MGYADHRKKITENFGWYWFISWWIFASITVQGEVIQDYVRSNFDDWVFLVGFTIGMAAALIAVSYLFALLAKALVKLIAAARSAIDKD